MAPTPTNLVEVEAFTKTKEIPAGGDTFPVLVRVKAAADWAPRAGVDVVIVLDLREAIQQGQKLERLKEALMVVIGKLGACDRLAVISSVAGEACHLVAPTYMSCRGRWKAITAIQRLVLGADDKRTNVCLEEGVKVLMELEKEEKTSRRKAGCVMFLSDGECSPVIERETFPYPVHTFGLGAFGLGAGHDPEGMKRIADKTGGTYSFVDQDAGDFREAFAPLIAGLTSVAATAIKITLKAHEGVTISYVESGAYEQHVSDGDLSCDIEVTDIYAGEQKNFIVHLKVNHGEGKLVISGADGKEAKLVTVGGEYLVVGGSNKVLPGTDVCVVPPREVPGPEACDIHPEVAVELTRVKLWKFILKMLELSGDCEIPTNDGIQQILDEFKDSVAGSAAAKDILSQLGRDVAAMEIMVIGKTEEHRKSGGLAYMLSWVSCHQWQRATTKGMTSSSVAYRVVLPGGAAARSSTIDRSCSCLGSYRAVLLLPFLLLMRMLYIYSVGGGFRFGLGFGFGSSTAIMPQTWTANGTALDLSAHPHWPIMEQDFQVMIRKTEDVKITSFFNEASVEAMNDQMDRYLYLAIVHATALRRRHAGYAISDAAAVRSAAGAYLQDMVDRMRDVELPSFEDTSPKIMNYEMNRYLYSTIVQSSVVWSHTERFHEDSMVTDVTKKKSIVSKTIDGKTVLVETEEETVSTMDGETMVVVSEEGTIASQTVVVVAENATSSTTVSSTDIVVVAAEMAKATVRITELEQQVVHKTKLEIRVAELEQELVRKTWLEIRVVELEKEMVHKATLEVRVSQVEQQLREEKNTVVSLRNELATQRKSCTERCNVCDTNVKRCGEMVKMWKARVVALGGSVEEEKGQVTLTI